MSTVPYEPQYEPHEPQYPTNQDNRVKIHGVCNRKLLTQSYS